MSFRRIFRRFPTGKNQIINVAEVLPLVELLGNHRVLIENHKGIMLYSHNEIHINLNIGLLYITGYDLNIAYISGQRLVITGSIKCITISGK